MLRVRVKQFYDSYPRWPRLARLLVIICLFLLGFGTLIHLVEPQTFTFYDGIWWAIVTAGTIGYGDFVPVTPLGKAVGIILIFSGAGIVATYFASIAAVAASSEKSFIEGKKPFKGKDQLIIVGWNERSRYIIADMHEREPQLPIVLIDESLPRHPLPRTNIHFIHGRAAEDSILFKANIHEAKQILITADLQQNEFHTDMFSILTLLAVKGLNPAIYCLIEILTEEQRLNALRAGANGLIETNKFASFYMVKALITGKTVFEEEELTSK